MKSHKMGIIHCTCIVCISQKAIIEVYRLHYRRHVFISPSHSNVNVQSQMCSPILEEIKNLYIYLYNDKSNKILIQY